MTATPFAKSYAIRRDKPDINIKRPRGASQSYNPGQICAVYGMPTMIPVVPGVIVIGELGGAFYPADVAVWAAEAGLPAPTVTTHLLAGASDSPSDADAEVALDWQRAAEWYSYMTGLPATIVIVYGPNTGQAFAACQNYARSLPNVLAFSWSWGSEEDGWASADRAALDASAQACPFPICAASGDNDSTDGSRKSVTDYPASSPYVVGCGGTSRPPSGPETVWNNGNGEGTGGGFSKVYARPAWQPANSQGTGRMVPDCAANADPNSGYNTLINGSWQVIGGTSAVAPLMAGFLAVVNGARLKAGLQMLGVANAQLWANASSYFDITSGNNGAYKAVVGPDPCSGLGRPLGTLLSALDGSGSTPIPPPVVTPPPVTTSPVPASMTLTTVFTGSVSAITVDGVSIPLPAAHAHLTLPPIGTVVSYGVAGLQFLSRVWTDPRIQTAIADVEAGKVSFEEIVTAVGEASYAAAGSPSITQILAAIYSLAGASKAA